MGLVRGWVMVPLLGVCLSLGGCSGNHDAPSVFMRSESLGSHPIASGEGDSSARTTQDSAAAVPRKNGKPAVRILSPADGDTVSQMGSVRFCLEGGIPVGVKPVLFVQDATGLDTNWWCYRPSPATDREFGAGVQYGLPQDQGRFHLAVLLLHEAACPKQGAVGPLPANALAASAHVEVVRQ